MTILLNNIQECPAINAKNALATYLGINANDIQESSYDEMVLEADGNEYLVLDDEKADEYAKDRIKESLWAFNADFILRQCDLPLELTDAIKAMQEKECESCNDTILSIIERAGDFDDFAENAIDTDGRAHFLNTYDGEENESTINGITYYIYKL